jgi:hypothetical protein
MNNCGLDAVGINIGGDEELVGNVVVGTEPAFLDGLPEGKISLMLFLLLPPPLVESVAVLDGG